MKLYEVSTAEPGIMRLRDARYFTSQAEAMKVFRRAKKTARIVNVYQVNVRTDLKAADWCKLLAADALAGAIELTPQDLITEHTLVATFEKDYAAA